MVFAGAGICAFVDERHQFFGVPSTLRLGRNPEGNLNSRPKWWGKLVIELIYDTLDPDVAEYLKNNKPPPGVRWHRQLTENIGIRALASRCYEVIEMAKECRGMRELRDNVARHYGRQLVQFSLSLPNPEAPPPEPPPPFKRRI
jgi:hypothetical protein